MRDVDRWFESQRRLDQNMGRLWRENPDIAPVEIARLVQQIAQRDTFGNRMDDRDHRVEVFERHIAEICAGLPEDRLLVLDVADGWDPLCAFLGVDVPDDEPFPHLNAADSINDNALAALAARRP